MNVDLGRGFLKKLQQGIVERRLWWHGVLPGPKAESWVAAMPRREHLDRIRGDGKLSQLGGEVGWGRDDGLEVW